MYKWTFLGVVMAFLGYVSWVIWDVRIQFKESGNAVNQHLPAILTQADTITQALARDLPQLSARTRESAENIAEMIQDIRDLKEFVSDFFTEANPESVKYVESLLTFMEQTKGFVGTQKSENGELDHPVSTRRWAISARKEARFLMALRVGKDVLVSRLCSDKFGTPLYIDLPGGQRYPLMQYLRSNHKETAALFMP